jgi:hypothetical protein
LKGGPSDTNRTRTEPDSRSRRCVPRRTGDAGTCRTPTAPDEFSEIIVDFLEICGLNSRGTGYSAPIFKAVCSRRNLKPEHHGFHFGPARAGRFSVFCNNSIEKERRDSPSKQVLRGGGFFSSRQR